MLKRAAAFLFLLGLAVVPAFGADFGNANVLKQIGCTDKETEEILAIEKKYSAEVDSYKTEMKSIKAQLKELEAAVDMDVAKADKLLQKFYDSQYKEDLAKFAKNAKIKKILGQDRWDKALKLLKNKKNKA
jgi:Spy/CpxP family protein refolding chaperone